MIQWWLGRRRGNALRETHKGRESIVSSDGEKRGIYHGKGKKIPTFSDHKRLKKVPAS